MSSPRVLAGCSLMFGLAATAAMAGVDLRLTREAPTQIRLDWTAAGTFAIYRSPSPAGVVSPSNLLATVTGTSWTDTNAVGTLLFYKVEPYTCVSPEDCQDGTLCNGQETCVGDTCQPGTPPNCDDGVACTVDACNPATGCTHTPNDGACPCGQTCDSQSGCSSACTVRTCNGVVYQCGDCIDNDGDCLVDAADDQCLGPCDNSENSLYPAIPGFSPPLCTQDCFFDRDTGSGNDDCTWTHRCDPLSVAPNYPPSGSNLCSYNPAATVGGRTCTQMDTSQSATCTEFCGSLTPNGCDSFGCCSIPGAPTPVWLGSLDGTGSGSCSLATLGDPSKCKPCTQVTSTINSCDLCELCVGKTTLPGGCVQQTCPLGLAACGLPGQAPCAGQSYCISGCCQLLP